MLRFVYAWNVNTDTWMVRAVVGPVPDGVVGVDQVVEPTDVDALLRQLDADCAPPWCVHGEMLAASWSEVEDRVRGWHFT